MKSRCFVITASLSCAIFSLMGCTEDAITQPSTTLRDKMDKIKYMRR